MEVEEEEKEQFPIISSTPQYGFSTTVIEKYYNKRWMAR